MRNWQAVQNMRSGLQGHAYGCTVQKRSEPIVRKEERIRWCQRELQFTVINDAAHKGISHYDEIKYNVLIIVHTTI
jgi:hypothetical protein